MYMKRDYCNCLFMVQYGYILRSSGKLNQTKPITKLKVVEQSFIHTGQTIFLRTLILKSSLNKLQLLFLNCNTY